ncbi:hypothetical protein [Ancylomarina longa]|uniref:hypothetical protein n=1 Tax=Ancylomarina longa TaxID=2487017 RepID=UPI000FCAEBEF|nr:hypothetical protein [Ancylomarina longa]
MASALTGGVGGPILNMVADVLGINSTDSNDLEKAIQNNPDAIVKLKELEMKHREKLQRLSLEIARVDFERDQAYLSDKVSARSREVEITKATGHRDVNLYILAWTVVAAFFILTGILIYKPLSQDASGYINQLFGAMATGFGLVLSYFFGSSRSSAVKQDMLHEHSMKLAQQDPFRDAKG